MNINAISLNTYKTPNFKSKKEDKISSLIKDTSELAIITGVFLNINTFMKYKEGTKLEKFGKFALLAGLVLDFANMIYQPIKKYKK